MKPTFLFKEIIQEIYIYIYITRIRKRPLSREFRLKLSKFCYLQCEQKFLFPPKNSKFFFDLSRSIPAQFLPFCIWIFYTYIYEYFISIGGRKGCCGRLNRDKENEDARNPFLYAFCFSHHVYLPIKRETRKGLMPNKNHIWNIFFK